MFQLVVHDCFHGESIIDSVISNSSSTCPPFNCYGILRICSNYSKLLHSLPNVKVMNSLGWLQECIFTFIYMATTKLKW